MEQKNTMKSRIQNYYRNICSPFFLFLLIITSTIMTITPNNTVQGLIGITNQNPHQQSKTETVLTLISTYPKSYGSIAKGFAKENNYVYTTINFNPSIIDIANLSSPTLVAKYTNITSAAETLALYNNLLIIGTSQEVIILNVSTPTNIKEVSRYNTTYTARSIIVRNNLAYLAAEKDGLVIVNISNPAQPEMLGQYDTNLVAWDIAIRDNLAYVPNTNYTGATRINAWMY